MDLARVNFALEVVQFFHCQAVEQFNPALDLEGSLQEVLVFLLLRTLECRGIIDAPMRGNRCSRKNGASLAGIVREGNDKVKVTIDELLPGISDSTSRVDLKVFAENLQGERMGLTRRSFTGASDFKAVAAERAKQMLGKDASLRVTSAEKQNTKR